MDSVEVINLKRELRRKRESNKKLNYDLGRMEYLLGECIVMMDKISNRALKNKDAFTTLWCETMVSDIRKVLDLPRFGVDVITKK